MKNAILGLLVILGTTSGPFLPQSAPKEPPRVAPDTIPTPEWSHPVGYPQSSPALLALDSQVAEYGVDRHFYRSVDYTNGLGERVQGAGAQTNWRGLAVVNYRLRREDDLGNGVVVWIKTWTGEIVIVPKAVLRAADRVVVRARIDLTQLSLVAERVGKRIHVQYHYRGAEDGEFVVKVEPHTAKADQKIYWWDGKVGRAHYP